jgi:hypothetical protein
MTKRLEICCVTSYIVKVTLPPGIIMRTKIYSEYSGFTSTIRSTAPATTKINEDSGDIMASPAIRISKTRTASHFTAEFLPHI